MTQRCITLQSLPGGGGIMLIKLRDHKMRWSVFNLHCFDDGNDACGPEAADGGEHGDGQVVVGRPAVHQGDAGGHLHGMNLSGWNPRVAPPRLDVGLTLREGEDRQSVWQLFNNRAVYKVLSYQKTQDKGTQAKRTALWAMSLHVSKRRTCRSSISNMEGNHRPYKNVFNLRINPQLLLSIHALGGENKITFSCLLTRFGG